MQEKLSMQERAILGASKYLESGCGWKIEAVEGRYIVALDEKGAMHVTLVNICDRYPNPETREREDCERFAVDYLRRHPDNTYQVLFDSINIMVIGTDRAFLRHHRNILGHSEVLSANHKLESRLEELWHAMREIEATGGDDASIGPLEEALEGLSADFGMFARIETTLAEHLEGLKCDHAAFEGSTTGKVLAFAGCGSERIFLYATREAYEQGRDFLLAYDPNVG